MKRGHKPLPLFPTHKHKLGELDTHRAPPATLPASASIASHTRRWRLRARITSMSDSVCDPVPFPFTSNQFTADYQLSCISTQKSMSLTCGNKWLRYSDITDVLRHGNLSPTLRPSIIALAQRQRYLREDLTNVFLVDDEDGRKSLLSYQAALSGLRHEISQMESSMPETMDYMWLEGALASALLLGVFAIPLPSCKWEQHITGLLQVIHSFDIDILSSRRLGLFVIMHTFQADISAFSLGRTTPSSHSWFEWHTIRHQQSLYHRDISVDDGWLPHEITFGYPTSMTDMIAQVAKWVDVDVQEFPTHTSDPVVETPELQSRFLHREAFIRSWQAPVLPQHMSADQKLALHTAWETIRRATLVYLWRGNGFHSHYLHAMRADRALSVSCIIRDTIVGVRGLIDSFATEHITIGNAMLWPLTVVACECIDAEAGWQAQIESLLDRMGEAFAMRHLVMVKSVLIEFWQRHSKLGTDLGVTHDSAALNLESIVRERGWVLPLL